MEMIAQLDWRLAVDVIVVALVLYELLLLVRGTRAFHILVGAALVCIFLYFAHRGGLPISGWIFQHLVPYGFFAFLLIFSAEIRQILARLGRAVTFAGARRDSESYDDIVMAAAFFSEQRIGALVVVERDVGLRTYVESGVPMDALLSYDLLATIFRPAAPLHDGAVIIRKDRVAAAACFLPLSMNPVLSNQLGTRHRAAIGITEETDAIAIIVSEETGQISLAQAGQIERNLSPERLRERLSKILHRYVPPVTIPTPISDEPDPAAALDRKTELES